MAGLTHFQHVGLETIKSKMLKKYSSTVEVKKSLLPLLYEIQTEESTQAVLGTGEVLYKGNKLQRDQLYILLPFSTLL